jgi:hypothetical protein
VKLLGKVNLEAPAQAELRSTWPDPVSYLQICLICAICGYISFRLGLNAKWRRTAHQGPGGVVKCLGQCLE